MRRVPIQLAAIEVGRARLTREKLRGQDTVLVLAATVASCVGIGVLLWNVCRAVGLG